MPIFFSQCIERWHLSAECEMLMTFRLCFFRAMR